MRTPGRVDPRFRGGDGRAWTRREFLGAAAAALGTAALARTLGAQPSESVGRVPAPRQDPNGSATPRDSAGAPPAPNAAAGADGTPSAANNVPMDPTYYKPVGLPPKPNARPQLTADQRDALEHRLKCQCPDTLDVYTCRTTSFTCGVAPAMHRDVLQLVANGYSGDEILQAFVGTYGERALMAPTKQGFNIAGYVMPFAVLGTGTVVVGSLMRRWSTRAQAAAAAVRAAHVQPAPASPVPARRGDPISYTASDVAALDATPDELARLEAAVRGEPA